MKVLIIDDEPLVRRALTRGLSARGHQVVEADNGVVGLDKWLEEKPDVIFLDVLMPGLSGPQVLEELGERKVGKVVLISAYTGEYNMEKAKQVGADLFIPKPFSDIFEVIERVEKIVNGGKNFKT